MRYITFIFFVFAFTFANASHPLEGTWQGVIIPAGNGMEKGTLLYADLSINSGSVSGKMREEIYNSENYAVKQVNGKLKNETLFIHQIVVERSTRVSRVKWCLMDMELQYDSLTGYMEGTFESSDCKRFMGKIILYKSDFDFSSEQQTEVSHLWFGQFLKDYKEGLNAPEIRKIERANFVFEPVYFDYDKYDIKSEYYAFLDRLIKVVKGHSDLRVKVTGHTDSDGSDAYNDTLSKNRAQAIIDYFVSKGLSADRLVFDFKGERQPADTNATPEGKQRNRRVDFSFI